MFTIQRFEYADKVFVDVKSPGMAHFTTGMEAYVIYSYRDKYGGTGIDSFCICFLHTYDDGSIILNESSWYHAIDLNLIKKNDLKGLYELSVIAVCEMPMPQEHSMYLHGLMQREINNL